MKAATEYELPESTRSFLAEAHESDPVDNERTTPPPNEKVRLWCIWVFEAYLPGEASRLLDRLRELGWDKPDLYRGTGDLNQWFRSARTYGGGSTSLGNIGPKGRNMDHHLKLPLGVKYVRADLGQVTPSVTIMGCRFILDEHTVEALEPPLHQIFETTVEKTDRGFAFPGPGVHKFRAVSQARLEIRDRCKTWLRQNFPGSFSAGLLAEEFPSAELITLELGAPFHGDDTSLYGTYLTTLGIGRDHDVWESERLSGIRLALPDLAFLGDHADRAPHNLVFAGRMSDILADKESPSDNTSMLGRVDMHVSWVISTWALSALMEGHEKKLAEMRDSALDSGADERSTIGRLRRIEGEVSSLARSIPFLATEVASHCSEKDFWYSEDYDFKRVDGAPGQLPLVQAFRDRMVSRAKRLREVEADVRQGILITSNLVSASLNLSLQKKMFWITAGAIVVAIGSLIVAILQLSAPGR